MMKRVILENIMIDNEKRKVGFTGRIIAEDDTVDFTYTAYLGPNGQILVHQDRGEGWAGFLDVWENYNQIVEDMEKRKEEEGPLMYTDDFLEQLAEEFGAEHIHEIKL